MENMLTPTDPWEAFPSCEKITTESGVPKGRACEGYRQFLSLQDKDISNWEFERYSFAGCDFRGAKAHNTRFTRVSFQEVYFEGADLKGARFVDCEFKDCKGMPDLLCWYAGVGLLPFDGEAIERPLMAVSASSTTPAFLLPHRKVLRVIDMLQRGLSSAGVANVMGCSEDKVTPIYEALKDGRISI